MRVFAFFFICFVSSFSASAQNVTPQTPQKPAGKPSFSKSFNQSEMDQFFNKKPNQKPLDSSGSSQKPAGKPSFSRSFTQSEMDDFYSKKPNNTNKPLSPSGSPQKPAGKPSVSRSFSQSEMDSFFTKKPVDGIRKGPRLNLSPAVRDQLRERAREYRRRQQNAPRGTAQ